VGRLTMEEQVIREIQKVLIKTCQLTHAGDKIASDRLKNISALSNSYLSLLESARGSKGTKEPPVPELTEEYIFENGLPGYYESLLSEGKNSG